MSEKSDAAYERLKASCETPLPESSAVGAFNWTVLLAMLPVILAAFVKDGALRERLQALAELIRELFAGGE